jgi:cytochrome c551/c552
MTPDEARAALREKVARAIADYELPVGPGWQDRWRDYLGTADAAIDLVLKEAAKVADDYRHLIAKDDDHCGSVIAAAIRGMIGKQDVHKT